MGRIDISFEIVRQKSDKLNGQIQSRLEKEMIAGYERLENSLLQSGGDAVETLVEELRQEKNTLMEMKNFMVKLLQLMQESADAFEETDISYKEAVQNLGQGET